MKKIIIILSFVVVVLTAIALIMINNDKKGFYSLKDDNITSIISVVGKRKLEKKTKSKNGDTIIKTYRYINVDDPYTDLTRYINFLESKSNFIVTKSYNLNNKIGDLELSRYSTNKEYIVIINISYTRDSYTIKLTRGRGKINSLNNS